jgi:hypothetical protein
MHNLNQSDLSEHEPLKYSNDSKKWSFNEKNKI